VLFNSYTFIFGFLPVTLTLFFLLGRAGRRGPALAWLLAASLIFYAWWNPPDLPFLLTSIALNYTLALTLHRVEDPGVRRTLTAAGIGANLLFLGYYKYAAFAAETLTAVVGVSWPTHHRPLPLGISFFTFQQIVFLVDAYRHHRLRTGPLRYATGVAFFPHLLAGPIVRYSQLMPQFSRRRILRPDAMLIAQGVTVFAIGLVKKVIVADSVAQFVPVPFGAAAAGHHLTLVEAWAAALSYTFQIYFDFSGYSDMAIGLALLFGIRLPINFDSPYKAAGIIDFWRRWHITLSAFLRDYVYIPLGGGREGTARRYRNLMITMVLGGLWHGAAWTFVAWGALHGIYLLINHGWRAIGLRPPRPLVWSTPRAARGVTFLAVVVAWVLFRAPSMEAAIDIMRAMAGGYGLALPRSWIAPLAARLGVAVPAWLGVGGMGTLGGTPQLAWLAMAAAIVWGLPNTQQWMAWWPGAPPSLRWRPAPRWALVTAALLVLGILGLTRASAFIYFNF
jgi:D-alanyl-lipoteichoic acid acyltransferase DltB (MBOAT superfamily)